MYTGETFIDGVGASHYQELPKLNVALLEMAIKWASRSRGGHKADYEPRWHQSSWGERIWFRTFLQGRNSKGQWTKSEVSHYCETNYCLAGYALEATDSLDWKPDWSVLSTRINSGKPYASEPMLKEEIQPYSGDVVDNSDHKLCFSDAGALVLGLTEGEAAVLFSGGNNITTMKHFAKRIAASRNEHIEI